NARFRKGEGPKRDFLAEQKASAKGQYPAAVILSCVDSRAPAEIVMDLGIGNVFNCRVAGNASNEDIVGSMEFACKVAGAKLILVMGHTSCGAIRGAIDNVELGNLTGLLARIRPAVKATEFKGERTSNNAAFVDAVARKNVELAKKQILEKSPVLRELESKRAIKVAGAMYDLETAAVDFFA
ncbi:MAG TPA: carbonic anhydrase family protein, partial [Gemmataceae bacterium]|nr:carbonic anhydrase family protein [Gemmataceae bacterium]